MNTPNSPTTATAGETLALDEKALQYAATQDLASRGIAYCADTSDRARRQLNQAADATARYVAEQPGKSLAIAAAAGAFVATLCMLARRPRGRDY